MRRFLLACSLFVAAFAARADIIDIDNAELAKLTAAGVPLIDIRTPQEWQETGIVPGSHLITFFDEQGKVDPAAWLEKAKSVAKPGEPVALICRSGNRTKAATRFLSQQAGYVTVYNVKEGIKGWTREGRTTAPAAPALAACRANRTC